MKLDQIIKAIFSFLFSTSPQRPSRTNTVPLNSDLLDPNLIPRKLLLGNPDKTSVSLSPDGKYVGYLAPVEGVLNIWVQPLDGLMSGIQNARPVTNDKGRGISSYKWTYMKGVLTFRQDKGGDENFVTYILDLNGQEPKVTQLSERDGSRTESIADSYKYPDISIFGINKRDPRYHDLYRADLKKGKLNLLLQNTGFMGFMFDNELMLRLATAESNNGGVDYFRPVFSAQGNGLQWRLYRRVKPEDYYGTKWVGFNKNNTKMYWFDSEGRNFNALYEVDLKNPDQKRLLYDSTKSDIDSLWQHPTEFTPLAVLTSYDYPEYHILDQSIQADMDYLKSLESDGRPIVSSTSLDFNTWMIVWLRSDKPAKFYIYDRSKQTATYLFTTVESLKRYVMPKMEPVEIVTRDGYTQLCYLTIPNEYKATSGTQLTTQPVPTILFVHGGPWARDFWGFDGKVKLFANRGYAVMQCNFRGSTGLGKEWINAGNGQWGANMHNDLLDAVQWGINARVSDPTKIAIVGASYGGYATLAGLTFTPDTFACGVDEVGPSNLETLLKSIPPYWKPMYNSFVRRLGGDPKTTEGKQFLRDRSPVYKADQIIRPLLIGQGANDPRVNRNESDQIVRAMTERSIPVTYILFPDEGHGFYRPQNRLAFTAIMEKFLAKCLGGKAEPIGDDIASSTALILQQGNLDLPVKPMIQNMSQTK